MLQQQENATNHLDLHPSQIKHHKPSSPNQSKQIPNPFTQQQIKMQSQKTIKDQSPSPIHQKQKQNPNTQISKLMEFSSDSNLPFNSNITMTKSNQMIQMIPFTPIKPKQQRSNFLSPGVSMLDGITILKQSNDTEKTGYPYGTKISALSQIKRKQSEEFDESLLQLTRTLKGRDGSALQSIQKQDSLIYSHDGISNIFITPVKFHNNNQSQKQQTDQKTAKTSNDQSFSPNGEHHNQIDPQAKQNYNQNQDQDQQRDINQYQDTPRINSRKLMKIKEQSSSKTLSNPSKLNKGRKLYHSSLGRSDNLRLKQAESKRRQLQKQLQILNGQITNIKQTSPKPHHNIVQRIHISDDINAKMKAIELVHRLNAQKKQRHKLITHQQTQLNRDAFESYEEIRKLREERQQKDKQKKRTDAIQRMKQQEIRKNQIKKLQKANVKFLRNVIWAQTAPLKQIAQQADALQNQQKDLVQDYDSNNVQLAKQLQKRKIIQQGKTPQLDNRKSRLKKIRNIQNTNQVKSILEEYNALLFKK